MRTMAHTTVLYHFDLCLYVLFKMVFTGFSLYFYLPAGLVIAQLIEALTANLDRLGSNPDPDTSYQRHCNGFRSFPVRAPAQEAYYGRWVQDYESR